MAKKKMSTPGAPAASRKGRERTSPLAPTGGGGPGLPLEDWHASGFAGQLRPRDPGAAGDNDSALGQKGTRSRTATTAGAQFRITVSHKAPQPQQYPGTLAGGKIVPPVMGSKQMTNFDLARQASYGQ